MMASHFPISWYKNRALRVKEVKIASKWPRPSSHQRVKLGIPSTTMVVIILQNTSYQIKFRFSKSKSITKANKNTNYRHFTYSLRIRCYLEFPAVFWLQLGRFFDSKFHYLGEFALPRIERRTIAPVALQPVRQLSRKRFVDAKGTWK